MEIYLQGLTMGLAYVAPIGLQNLFVINTAITQHRLRVYMTALIVIFFDVTLGMACFFGVGAVMESWPILEKAASASVIWFLGISTILSLFSRKITDKTLKIINIVCGIVIIFYGLKLFWSFVKML